MLAQLVPAITLRWKDLLDRLWFIPSLMTISAAILALVMVQIDRSLVGQRRPESDWLFGAGASGAREVLSAISGTMITVTGLTFSITVLTLQLASSQFTPRILRTFTGDRGNQLVLGVFISTFTYSLLVLRTVREASDDGEDAFVPSASVTVALLLTAASVGFLIYFISHVADSIRASVIIDRVTHDTLGVIRREFPDHDSAGHGRTTKQAAVAQGVVDIRSTQAGYLQETNDERLLALLYADDLTFRLAVQPGMFLQVGQVIGQVWPTDRGNRDELTGQINGALILGSERTLHADVELGLRQLADIAVKALSPGINDPTTATICIDRLAQILVEIASRPLPVTIRLGKDDRGTLQQRSLDWDTLVLAAFNEIRHYATGDPMVAAHLSRILRQLVDVVPADRVTALIDMRGSIIAGARRDLDDAGDIARVESAA